MRIYRVIADVNSYQAFTVEDAGVWQDGTLTFDGSSKKPTWIAPNVYVLHPKLKRGNFFDLCPGALVLDAMAVETLRDLLERTGELLPLNHKGEQYSVLNVTDYVNVLDENKTNWILGKTTGARIRIEKYAFHVNRLTESPLFKIPETCRSEILTVEGLKAPEEEFKYNVEQKGLKGILFEEVWRSDQ